MDLFGTTPVSMKASFQVLKGTPAVHIACH
jgi:hypothetical protein